MDADASVAQSEAKAQLESTHEDLLNGDVNKNNRDRKHGKNSDGNVATLDHDSLEDVDVGS